MPLRANILEDFASFKTISEFISNILQALYSKDYQHWVNMLSKEAEVFYTAFDKNLIDQETRSTYCL